MASSSAAPLTFPEHCHEAIFKVLSAQRWSYKVSLPRKRNKQAALLNPAALSASVDHAFANDLAPVLPSPNSSMRAPVIVDIGSGLALYHVHIARWFGGRATHYLVDRSLNEIPARGFGSTFGYHPAREGAGRFSFYNSLDCARDTLVANGILRHRLHLVNASSQAVAALGDASADIVMSLWSWGFHYPVETYLEAASGILRPAGLLILFVDIVPRRYLSQLQVLRGAGFRCTNTSIDYRLGGTRNLALRLTCQRACARNAAAASSTCERTTRRWSWSVDDGHA